MNVSVLTVAECLNAYTDPFLGPQEGKSVPETLLNWLFVYHDSKRLFVCVGRHQMFVKGKSDVQIFPFNSLISTLLGREAHIINPKGIAGRLPKMRESVWVVKRQKLTKRMVNNCIVWKKIQARQCQQVMRDLPPKSLNSAKTFDYTPADLWKIMFKWELIQGMELFILVHSITSITC